tara:strand:+ start:617 stop:2071 length:1455 start_codon:yes stop_codon:yes gene_type:complete
MNELLNYTICSGLKLPINEKEIPKILDIIPESCFGVFVTARRTHEYYRQYKRKIKTHGCQGYWDKEYKELPKETIRSKLQEISSATTSNKDKRKRRFKKLIQQDAGANYEVNFMMKPVFNINEQTAQMDNGDRFNNVDYGLIFVSQNGKRATYLPRTWVKKTWTEIKTMLRKKAGDTEQATGKFYAYKTISYKDGVLRLFQPDYLNFLVEEYSDYINNNYNDFIPYQTNLNNSSTINKDKNIRNLMSIDSILNFQSYLHSNVLSSIDDNLEYYKQKFYENKKSMRQASSFLVLALNKVGDDVEEICDYLYGELPKLEHRFERGEVLLSLCETCGGLDILSREERRMYDDIIEKTEVTTDDIFQYNWHAQYLNSLYKKHNIILQDHIDLLFHRMSNIINSFINPETNYLAVSLEGLAALYPLIQNPEDKNRLTNDMFHMFYRIQKRYKNGLYFFKNGIARMDITAHVMNAYNILLGELNEQRRIK